MLIHIVVGAYIMRDTFFNPTGFTGNYIEAKFSIFNEDNGQKTPEFGQAIDSYLEFFERAATIFTAPLYLASQAIVCSIITGVMFSIMLVNVFDINNFNQAADNFTSWAAFTLASIAAVIVSPIIEALDLLVGLSNSISNSPQDDEYTSAVSYS